MYYRFVRTERLNTTSRNELAETGTENETKSKIKERSKPHEEYTMTNARHRDPPKPDNRPRRCNSFTRLVPGGSRSESVRDLDRNTPK